MPTAPGIGRREFNQVTGYIISALREAASAPRNIAAAIAAATASAASASASAVSASNSANSASAASSSAASAAAAIGPVLAIAASAPFPVFDTAPHAISNGVKNYTSLVGGSGGTNGTFALTVSGGGGSGFIGRFVVVGGAVVAIYIDNPGNSFTSAPTFSFSASTGLTGASATAVIGANVPVGGYFYTPTTDPSLVNFYSVTTGPVANILGAIPSASATFSTTNARISGYRGNTQDVANPYVRAPLSTFPASISYKYWDDITGWTTSGVTVNADGTITLAAGATMISQSLNNGASDTVFGTSPVYIWITEVSPTPGVFNLTNVATYSGSNAPVGSAYSTTTSGVGIYKFMIQNNNGSGSPYPNFKTTITNTGASSITIYPLMATLVNSTTPPAQRRFDQIVPVKGLSKPVKDFYFWKSPGFSSDVSSRVLSSRSLSGFLDSVNGLDANNGTSIHTPKQTVASLLPSGMQTDTAIAIARKSKYLAQIFTYTGGSYGGNNVIQDFIPDGDVSARMPIITCHISAPSGSFTSNGDGTYTYNWTSIDPLFHDGYNYVYPVEITTATEAATPYGSTNQMLPVSSQVVCAANPGTYYKAPISAGSATTAQTLLLHPSDSLAPGAGAYRYEVTTLLDPLYATGAKYPGFLLSGVELVGASHGYGPFAGPANSVIDRCIFAYGGTHQTVSVSGIIQRSLWYHNLKINDVYGQVVGGAVFYKSTSVPGSNTVRYSWFIGGGGFESHTSGTLPNYTRTAIHDCWITGGRYTKSYTASTTAFNSINVGDLMPNTLAVTGGTDLFTTTSIFYKQLQSATTALGTTYDSLIQDCGTVGAGPIVNSVIFLQPNTQVGIFGYNSLSCGSNVQSCLVHMKATMSCIITLPSGGGNVPNDHNIFLIENTTANNINIASTNAGQPLTDYNLYILVSGNDFTANRHDTGIGVQYGWDNYVNAYTTQDQHSMFVDLRADPRGVKAVFLDPVNGDYRWADTDVAKKCADFCLANGIGPSWTISGWPVVPTVDAIAQIIREA